MAPRAQLRLLYANFGKKYKRRSMSRYIAGEGEAGIKRFDGVRNIQGGDGQRLGDSLRIWEVAPAE